MRKGLYRIILMFEFFKTWFHTLDTTPETLPILMFSGIVYLNYHINLSSPHYQYFDDLKYIFP